MKKAKGGQEKKRAADKRKLEVAANVKGQCKLRFGEARQEQDRDSR